MRKEKVYIVLSHKHVLKTPGKKGIKPQSERVETVEFVNQLRTKHLTMSSAIGDYTNRKMERGERFGMGDYSKFEEYVRASYAKEMAQLDAAYLTEQVEVEVVDAPAQFTDEFGNERAPTVFDKVSA